MGDDTMNEPPPVATGPLVEPIARVLGELEFPAYRNNHGLWREHWEWFVRARGYGTSVDYSNQAKWARQAEALLVAYARGEIELETNDGR